MTEPPPRPKQTGSYRKARAARSKARLNEILETIAKTIEGESTSKRFLTIPEAAGIVRAFKREAKTQ